MPFLIGSCPPRNAFTWRGPCQVSGLPEARLPGPHALHTHTRPCPPPPPPPPTRVRCRVSRTQLLVRGCGSGFTSKVPQERPPVEWKEDMARVAPGGGSSISLRVGEGDGRLPAGGGRRAGDGCPAGHGPGEVSPPTQGTTLPSSTGCGEGARGLLLLPDGGRGRGTISARTPSTRLGPAVSWESPAGSEGGGSGAMRRRRRGPGTDTVLCIPTDRALGVRTASGESPPCLPVDPAPGSALGGRERWPLPPHAAETLPRGPRGGRTDPRFQPLERPAEGGQRRDPSRRRPGCFLGCATLRLPGRMARPPRPSSGEAQHPVPAPELPHLCFGDQPAPPSGCIGSEPAIRKLTEGCAWAACAPPGRGRLLPVPQLPLSRGEPGAEPAQGPGSLGAAPGSLPACRGWGSRGPRAGIWLWWSDPLPASPWAGLSSSQVCVRPQASPRHRPRSNQAGWAGRRPRSALGAAVFPLGEGGKAPSSQVLVTSCASVSALSGRSLNGPKRSHFRLRFKLETVKPLPS